MRLLLIFSLFGFITISGNSSPADAAAYQGQDQDQQNILRRQAEERRRAEDRAKEQAKQQEARAQQQAELTRQSERAAADAERMRQDARQKSRITRDEMVARIGVANPTKADRELAKKLEKARKRLEKDMSKVRSEQNAYNRTEILRRAEYEYQRTVGEARLEHRRAKAAEEKKVENQ